MNSLNKNSVVEMTDLGPTFGQIVQYIIIFKPIS